MTTKELAELVFGKPVDYKTKEYSSISRSLHSLEKRGLIKRVQIQLRWKLVGHFDKKMKSLHGRQNRLRNHI
jgi:predicted transcriptional regulator